jgi:hypothetical protein
LLRHHLLLLHHRLLMGDHFLVSLLLLLHCFKKILLLIMLHDLLSGLSEARQYLFCLIDAKPHRLSLCECYLHGAQLTHLRYEDTLFVEIIDCLLGSLDRSHPDESATDSTLRLRGNNKDLKHVAKLFEALQNLLARDLSWESSDK